jgi:hypothetical protein
VDQLARFGDTYGLTASGVRGRGVAGGQALDRDRQEQIPPLDAVQVAVVEQSPGASEPAVAAGHLAAVQEFETQPERAPGGTGCIPHAQAFVERSRRGIVAVVVPARQIGSHGEPLEIRSLEWRLVIRRGEFGDRVRPGPPIEGVPAATEGISRGHALSAPEPSPKHRLLNATATEAHVEARTRRSMWPRPSLSKEELRSPHRSRCLGSLALTMPAQ